MARALVTGRPSGASRVALSVSVLLHLGMIGVGARWLGERASAREHGVEKLVEVAVLADGLRLGQVTVDASGVAHRPPARVEAARRAAGLEQAPRPDTRTRGRGGTSEASDSAQHLSDSIDGLTLDTDPTLLTEESQLSRLLTAEERRSREDRRTTPNPMELTFIASGSGTRLERRTPAPTDPASGGAGAVPVLPGTRTPEERPLDPGPNPPAPERLAPGAIPVPARGVALGSSRPDFRRSAAVAVARPAIRQGRASIATATRGRPSDTADSSQEVASLVQALITASSAGGPLGSGPGGVAGVDGSGEGSTSGHGTEARPSGEDGEGGPPSALGITGYAASVTRKVYPFWEDAFPQWARLEGRGGVAVIGVTLERDGRITDLHVVRGSGFPEFDRNVARALELASPYGPLPRAVQRTGLTLHIAFDALNPAVGRAGPGPGRR